MPKGFQKGHTIWLGKRHTEEVKKKIRQANLGKKLLNKTKIKISLSLRGNKNWNYSHGMNGTKFYNIWKGIKQRCGNPSYKRYKDYGGRGIKNEWKSFEEFKQDMYKSYLEHKKNNKQTTIDRVENDGNYSRENCRWATNKEQQNNTRKTK